MLVLLRRLLRLLFRRRAKRLLPRHLRRRFWLFASDDWEEVEKSDNWHLGNIENVGKCPCEQDVTLDNEWASFDHKPSDDECKALLDKIEEPSRPKHACKRPCDWVVTENWKDWILLKHKTKDEWLLNCFWSLQWHCVTGGGGQ